MDTQANLWTFTGEIEKSIATLEDRNAKTRDILAQVKDNMNLLMTSLSQPAATSTKPSKSNAMPRRVTNRSAVIPVTAAASSTPNTILTRTGQTPMSATPASRSSAAAVSTSRRKK